MSIFGKSRLPKAPANVKAALKADFNDFEISVLNSLSTGIRLTAGSNLTVEGTPGGEALVIIEGTAAVLRDDTVVASLSAGDIVGEVALLTGELRNATVVATSAVTVFVMNRREFASVMHQCPRLASRVRDLALARSAA